MYRWADYYPHIGTSIGWCRGPGRPVAPGRLGPVGRGPGGAGPGGRQRPVAWHFVSAAFL